MLVQTENNLSLIYYILDFNFLMSQDDAYFHIHQNDPTAGIFQKARTQNKTLHFSRGLQIQKYHRHMIVN